MNDADAPAIEPSKAEVLEHLVPEVETFVTDHLQKRRLWHSSDFLPADERMSDDEEANLAALRERARGIDDAVRVSITLNLITEEGLPFFHRVIATHLGEHGVWARWNAIWTAEEDRHGGVLRDYVRDARLLHFRHLELMQFAYHEGGFLPDWVRDPYRLFVYTSLQERATQFAHQNTGKAAAGQEPLLRNIFASIAADEARHHAFYRKVFKSILRVDVNRALESALAILPAIEMPGFSMPHFREMADVVRRSGIYGPWDFKRIVEEVVEYWQIDALTGLSEAGRKAQEKIMAIPRRLQKVAEYIEQKSAAKSFSFDFLWGRAIEVGP